MRKFLFLLFISCTLQTLIAQETQQQKGYHQHDGFYLSMALGPVLGNINNESTVVGNQTYTGPGFQFDFKIGGAISENFILHATLASSSMVGPKVSGNNGSSSSSTNDVMLGEAILGAGFTYYFMPSNFFISSSAGAGNFTVVNTKTDYGYSTKRGFSMQIKIGKEWWVSKNWGLGIGVTYSKTQLTDTPNGEQEKLNSNRFGILFNTTFN